MPSHTLSDDGEGRRTISSTGTVKAREGRTLCRKDLSKKEKNFPEKKPYGSHPEKKTHLHKKKRRPRISPVALTQPFYVILHGWGVGGWGY